jgi:hypothetical protein
MTTFASTKKDTLRAEAALEAAKGNKKARKSTTTEYVDGYENLIDRTIRRKFVAEEAKRIYNDTEAEVITIAEEIYEKHARAGLFSKSVNFAGEEFEGLNVSFPDSFSGIPTESKDTIIEAYVNSGMKQEEAEKAFAQNFTESRTVKMVDTSNETISALFTILKFGKLLAADDADVEDIAANIEKLRRDLRGRVSRGGKLDFGEIFSSDVVLVPTTGMDERQFDQPEAVRGLLKQKKASTKMKVKVATAAAAEEAMRDVASIIRETTKD